MCFGYVVNSIGCWNPFNHVTKLILLNLGQNQDFDEKRCFLMWILIVSIVSGFAGQQRDEKNKMTKW